MADGLFDQFRNWYEKRHDYARDWKVRTGGQVVATMCTYTAEELLIAAGMLPVRVLGAHEPQTQTPAENGIDRNPRNPTICRLHRRSGG